LKTIAERIKNGVLVENPTFVQVIGMCPTLAVTTAAKNGIGMGLATTAVLIGSNVFISLLRKFIPSKIRIPAYIVIIASFVTLVEFLMQGFVPALYKQLGLFIPLIVVNCIILARAEAYASKNDILTSLFDGLGMGLGFTLALTVIGSVREILGAGQWFGIQIMPSSYQPAIIMILAPGAFFTLGILMAILNYIRNRNTKKA
jgi:electron transport complex protein RnfE